MKTRKERFASYGHGWQVKGTTQGSRARNLCRRRLNKRCRRMDKAACLED